MLLHHSVNYSGAHLDSIFGALTDPTRRAILERLERRGSASVGELAEPFAISLPAVMKHLDVLADAGLIARSKQGRTVSVTLQAQPMRRALAWLARYERFWDVRLDRLARVAEKREAALQKKNP